MNFAKSLPLLFFTCLLLVGGEACYLWIFTEKTLAETPVISNEPTQDAIHEIEAIVMRQSAAWNRGDIAEFMIPYWRDERLTFSSGGTTTRGWDTTFQRYTKKYPDRAAMGKLIFGDLESQSLSDDVVLMLGTWRLERAQPAEGNFSLVWKRIDGKWVIVHDHSSLKPN